MQKRKLAQWWYVMCMADDRKHWVLKMNRTCQRRKPRESWEEIEKTWSEDDAFYKIKDIRLQWLAPYFTEKDLEYTKHLYMFHFVLAKSIYLTLFSDSIPYHLLSTSLC